MNGDILIIDDEKDICELVGGILTDEGFTTRTAQNTEQALLACSQRFPQCIILDIWLKESQMDGLQLCAALKKQNPHTPIIMMSGHGTIELAVEAIKLGAYNFLTKPFRADHLVHLVEKSLNDAQKNIAYQEMVARHAKNSEFYWGSSAAVKELIKKIEKTAPTNARVLISGGYGANQYLIAQTIAEQSGKKPVITCDCANNNHVSQLFGGDDVGICLLEQCHNGILILNEVQFLPRAIQEKLQQFMVGGKFTRAKDAATITIDARILATISLNDHEVAGQYLVDGFLTRLASVAIHAPSLVERLDDLPELTAFYLAKIADILNIRPPIIDPQAIEMFKQLTWHKNYWQLYNSLERIIIQNPHKNTLTPADIDIINKHDDHLPNWALHKNFKDAMGEFERRFIEFSLNQFQGHISKTAEFLGMDRATLHRKLPKQSPSNI